MITEVTKRINFQREYKVKRINDVKTSIVLFRTGDFYVTYCEDADILSKEVGITRCIDHYNNCSYAGFPTNKLDSYLPLIIRKGYKVVICKHDIIDNF